MKCPMCPQFDLSIDGQCVSCGREWEETPHGLVSKPRKVRVVAPIQVGKKLDDCVRAANAQELELEGEVMALQTLLTQREGVMAYVLAIVCNPDGTGVMKGDGGKNVPLEAIANYVIQLRRKADQLENILFDRGYRRKV